MLKKTTFFLLIMTAILLVGCNSGSASDESPPPPDVIGNSPASTPDQTSSTGDNSETPSQNDEETQPDSNDPAEFYFIYNGVEVRMGEPALPIIEKLGPYQEYFESPSCAFDGIDKSWYYSGFIVHAYPYEGDDFILSVCLTDDSSGTDTQIYIGNTYEDMVAAYGSGYEQNQDQYLYRLGGTSLSFIISGGFIASITYRYEDAPELEL